MTDSNPTNTIALGIFGWPVEHSKSPQMHLAAAKALGIDLTYERFEVHPDDLAQAVAEKRAEGIRGFNVTLPHKEAMMDLIDEADEVALAIGAVNTVVHEAGRLVGYNTDALGLVRSLQDAGVDVSGRRVAIVGAGGAARAAAAGLGDAGAESIHILARRANRADALRAALSPHVRCEITAGRLEQAEPVFTESSLVVQATSATLKGNAEAESFAQALPLEVLPKDAVVVDLVYEPLETAVIIRARELGLRTVDGLGMLLHQGALAFQHWTGQSPPLDAMRSALALVTP